MNSKGFEYYRKRLLEARKETVHTLDIEDENGVHNSLQNYYNELSIYDNHPADIASETYEMEMRINLEDKEQKYLEKIDNALKRIEDGTYGICEDCGRTIELDRLEIIPIAEKCISCSNEENNLKGKMASRPIEEEKLNFPYGRTFNDNSGFNNFDGEDAWQSVARFNKTDERKKALDWYDNNMYDEKTLGKAEDVDDISDEYYKSLTNDKKED